MFGLGTQELLIIFLIALFVFGGKKLPEIGAGLGKGLRAFKTGLKDMDNEIEDNTSSSKEEDSPKKHSSSSA